MLLYDIAELKFNGAIIDTATSKLLFYTDESGAMVLSVTLKDSNGRVFLQLTIFTCNFLQPIKSVFSFYLNQQPPAW